MLDGEDISLSCTWGSSAVLPVCGLTQRNKPARESSQADTGKIVCSPKTIHSVVCIKCVNAQQVSLERILLSRFEKRLRSKPLCKPTIKSIKFSNRHSLNGLFQSLKGFLQSKKIN